MRVAKPNKEGLIERLGRGRRPHHTLVCELATPVVERALE